MLVIYVYGLLFARRNSYASTSNDSPIGQGPRPYVAYLENGNEIIQYEKCKSKNMRLF